MSETAKANAILEKLGSSHRVVIGDPIVAGLCAMMEALPDYIDRTIDERVAKAITDSTPKQKALKA